MRKPSLPLTAVLVFDWVLILALGASAQATCAQAPTTEKPQSKLTLDSPDAHLVEAFNWAKKQALSYAFDGDPVGPWYEAALPGREAFCMRDVSHQSMGAEALGLDRYTHNMLHRFAENVTESRDWASLWEINRLNLPPATDYKSDDEFWYDLPANFDVVDSCYRMYLWTGDTSYVNDPVFLNFYERTVNDYVARWDLGLDKVMTRKHPMNVRSKTGALTDKFVYFRGLPGYPENRQGYAVSVDLLATQYSAYRGYAFIQALKGNMDVAQSLLKKAAAVKSLVNTTWWNHDTHHFYSTLNKELQLDGEAGSALLYRDIAEDGVKAKAALDDFVAGIKSRPAGVEGQSHHAEILYRYGQPELAYQQMLDLTSQDHSRREYPEVSYSVVGAIVTGTMGINVAPPSPMESLTRGDYVEILVKTLSGLTKQTPWAELRNLPMRRNEISVRHDGIEKTTLTNQSGPSLIWQAEFAGSFPTLLVNGKPLKATAGKEYVDRVTSWVRVPVGAGDAVTVEIPK
jgi:hypothetical protein